MIKPNLIQTVELDGSSLTVEKVVAVARYHAKIHLSREAKERIKKSRTVVEEIISQGKVAYGINTGFGDFSKIRIHGEDIETLQNNLLLSHCVAVGDPYPEEVVRAMMTLRVNALCAGFSGIRPEVVQILVDMVNAGVHPVVPQKGSLGASGDLAPLAHMALPVIGKGEAVYRGQKMPGAEAMEKAGIQTCKLHAKEGLALINGTQAMMAVGTLAYYDSLCAARLADVAVSMTMDGLTALTNAFDEKAQTVRPHPGQIAVAENIRNLVKGSKILEKSQSLRVQDAYSLRCVPQVHGAVRDTLEYARTVLETEMNSVTDNPIVFPEAHEVISGGNFHGEPIAFIMDFLGIAISELANISERRIERLVNKALSEGLPAFLIEDGGLNSGYMICQYSAASMVSENKVYAHPASVDSIPSSANQEDHVSMGTTAARKLRMIVENTYSVLAFELMLGAQTIDLRGGEPSPVNKKVQEKIRSQVKKLDKDRELREDVTYMNQLVRSGEVLDIVSDCVPDFV